MQLLTLAIFFYAVIIALAIRTGRKEFIFALGTLYAILILFAAFRDGSMMPDYKVYSDKYSWEISGAGSDLEPSFKIICLFANILSPGNPYIMFLMYAILGVTLKFYSFKKLAPFFFFSIVIYISNFYILHELIQIRVGVATAILMIALVPLYERKYMKFFLLVIIATFFHYSSLAALVLWFFNPHTFSKGKWILLIIGGYVLYLGSGVILESLVGLLSGMPLLGKLVAYMDITRRNELALNPFGIYALTRLIICLFFISKYRVIAMYNKYYPFLLKVYVFGFFIYVAFASFPDIGYRISMLFMVTEIFLIPLAIFVTKKRLIGKLGVIAFGLLTILLNIFYTSYFSYSL